MSKFRFIGIAQCEKEIESATQRDTIEKKGLQHTRTHSMQTPIQQIGCSTLEVHKHLYLCHWISNAFFESGENDNPAT